MFTTQCDQCYKEFSNDSSDAVKRSLQSHLNKTGHQSAVIVGGKGSEKEAIVATEAPAKPTAEEKAAAAAEAKEARAAELAKAREDRLAARTADRESRPCECGCGGIPAGFKSRFIPGHDAKHASALKAAAASK